MTCVINTKHDERHEYVDILPLLRWQARPESTDLPAAPA
jgi:hypothetical protein